jgi:two-component system response regulator YesN
LDVKDEIMRKGEKNGENIILLREAIPSMKVLLVEDETIVRRFLRSLIDWEAHGYTIIGEAANGEEAWKLLLNTTVDIVLTDIRMPVLNGFELIERIGAHGLPCEVVILSSYDDFEYVRTALKLNVSDYVHKATISDAELLGCLQKAKADWLKKQAMRITEQSGAGHQTALAVNLLKMALGSEADPQYTAELSKGLGLWHEPFHVALIASDDAPELEADEEDQVVTFPFDKHWIVAGKSLDKPLAAWDADAIVVRYACAIAFADWPDVHAALKRELEQRVTEQDESRSFHASIRQALGYLQQHYRDDLTLEVMSEQVHVSPAYFSRLFQKETGVTFTQYLTQLRLQHAKSMLAQTEWPVYDIAERVGYRNTKYFMKLFKETIGCTPTEYREQLAKEK